MTDLITTPATPTRKLVSELIGRATSPYAVQTTRAVPTLDQTRPDYKFWSRLRRGFEPGYQLGGLFAKRICELDAEWVLGTGITYETGDDTLDELLTEFVADHHDLLLTWRKDASALGDAYLVVNPDATLTLVSPDQVTVQTAALDPSVVTGYTITTELTGQTIENADGSKTKTPAVTITDQYTRAERVIAIKLDGRPQQPMRFPNLIAPLLPVIPLHNDRESNELYGHPIYEALHKLFARYDDVISKSLDGVEIMGRPIPVAEGLQDVDGAMDANSTRTEQDPRTGEMIRVVDFEDLSMLWLGEGASFKFAAPGSFSADSTAMLKKLFYLMLEHIGIPEWAWGGAIASSKASVDAQMPAFAGYVGGRRTASSGPLRELARVWLAVKRLTMPLPTETMLRVVYPPIMAEDETLRVTKIKMAADSGLIQRETQLALLDLVEDPAMEVDAAASESAEQVQAERDRFDREFDALANQQNGDPSDESQV
jgi:hypothetical protein